MCDKKNQSSIKNKFYDDKTKYGETIPSMFRWITLEEQKKRAEELNNITKGK